MLASRSSHTWVPGQTFPGIGLLLLAEIFLSLQYVLSYILIAMRADSSGLPDENGGPSDQVWTPGGKNKIMVTMMMDDDDEGGGGGGRRRSRGGGKEQQQEKKKRKQSAPIDTDTTISNHIGSHRKDLQKTLRRPLKVSRTVGG